MRHAHEMNTIAKKALDAYTARLKAEAIEVVENKIAPRIEQSAERGGYTTTFSVDSHIALDQVVNELVANGYTVLKNGRHLTISW